MERCWDGGQLGRAHGQSRTEAAAGRGRDLAGASVAKLESWILSSQQPDPVVGAPVLPLQTHCVLPDWRPSRYSRSTPRRSSDEASCPLSR